LAINTEVLGFIAPVNPDWF